ncbi:hypothetical protein EV122DRAFT_294191 [Schizophyllum commune]
MSRRARCSTGWETSSGCSRIARRIVSVVEHGLKHATDAETAPGFHPHLPGVGHRWLGKLIGGSMWFFMFYRIRCVLDQVSSSFC